MILLTVAFVRPHLEYASPVWNPSTRKQIKMLEDVEKFAMKVATRRWDTGYQDVLNMANVPSLSPEGYNPLCAHCIRLYMVCATFLQTLSH